MAINYVIDIEKLTIEDHVFDSDTTRDDVLGGKVKVDLGAVMHSSRKPNLGYDYLSLSPSQLLLVQDEVSKTEKKYIGTLYNGYVVPVSSEDAMAMLQVKTAFELGVISTNIYFSNGTIMPMTSVDFPAFAQWFVTQRNSLFL